MLCPNICDSAMRNNLIYIRCIYSEHYHGSRLFRVFHGWQLIADIIICGLFYQSDLLLEIFFFYFLLFISLECKYKILYFATRIRSIEASNQELCIAVCLKQNVSIEIYPGDSFVQSIGIMMDSM